MEKVTQNQIQETPKKQFNISYSILKIILIGLAVAAILYSAKAAFTDTVLENLEKNYNFAIYTHNKNFDILKKSLEVEKASADAACSAYKALKEYKISKKIELKGGENPCMIIQAPQEGF